DKIAWQRPPADGADQFRQFPAEALLTIARLPAAFAGPAKAAIGAGIKGRIVMVGGTFADRDRHPTPLAVVSAEPTSGVLIHATIATQLLEGRAIMEPAEGLDLLLIALVAGTAVWLGWRHAIKRFEFAIALIGALVLIAADFGIYAAFGSVLPLNTHWQVWALGLTAGSWIAGRQELEELRLRAGSPGP
ncbi:MAG: CHASE2 domain-containing protein, partial [Pseudomonadota bacterium]